MRSSHDLCAVIGATIIDGNGGNPISNGVILIDGARIAAVGDRSLEIPPSTRRIEANGKFIIPGLISAYSYLTDAVSTMTLIRYEGRYDQVAIEAAQLTLKEGLTTVFDGWGPRDATISAREAIKRGQVVASRIYVAGNLVGCDGPFSRDLVPEYRVAVPEPFASRIDNLFRLNVGAELTRMAPDQVRAEVRAYARSGIDVLNYALVDHQAFQYIAFSPRVQQLIVDEAHLAGLPVGGGGTMSGEALALGIDAGIDVASIGTLFPLSLTDETLELVSQRQLACTYRFETNDNVEWFRERAKTHPTAMSRDILHFGEASGITARQLFGAGAAPLLAAPGKVANEDEQAVTDGMFPPGYQALGQSHFSQLRAMQEFGLRPMAVLMAATRNVAKAYKVDKDLGTLEKAKMADLLILDGNPLESVEHYRKISLIMKEGQVVDRDALPTKRLVSAPRGQCQESACG